MIEALAEAGLGRVTVSMDSLNDETFRTMNDAGVGVSTVLAGIDAASDADLIVMGTHGRGGPGRWWLGSVAERVLGRARVPVLVVRADESRHEPAVHFDRVLVVVHGAATDAAERCATGLAASFGGQPVERLHDCSEAIVEGKRATLLAIGLSGSGTRLPELAERMIRTCALPMLFVPEG